MKGVLIGLGNVALEGHLPAWKSSKDFQIAAGVDSSEERRKLFQQKMPGVPVFDKLEACDTKVDFADICTPPHTHFELVAKALERNLHVLCEKPLVLNKVALDALEQAAHTRGRVLMTVHNWKFAPICRKITEIVESGVLGDIRYASWYVLRTGPSVTTDKENWRLDPAKSGGGILIDHGWHAFYLLLHWMKSAPKSVLATLENRQYEDLPVEDTAKVKIDFRNSDDFNASVEVFLTWASRLRKNWGVLEGTRGTLQMEDDILKLSRAGSAEIVESYKFDQALSAGSHHPEWFEHVIHEFKMECNHEAHRGKNFAIAEACLGLIERAKESHDAKSQVKF